MAEKIECYPLRLRYTKGRGRTAKNRGSYITKCIRNQEKRQEQRLKVKMREAKETEKCPCCNWGVSRLYGLNCNPDNEMLCGDCFCDLLAEEGYKIER